jgi:Na+/H+-dicarboxylate symporter
LSLPVKILLGAGLGLLAGVFFGDSCAVLRPVGKAYVMCLQAPVYPYLVAALMHGVGVLQPAVAWKLVKRGGLFLLRLPAGCPARGVGAGQLWLTLRQR